MRPDGKGGGSVQKPVRYYILQAEDQPVVRSVPVPLRRDATPRLPVAPTIETAAVEPEAGRTRVARLMRAAVRRNRRRRHGR